MSLECLEPVLHKKSPYNEKTVLGNEELPLLTTTRECLCVATKTQHSQKQVKINLKKKKEYRHFSKYFCTFVVDILSLCILWGICQHVNMLYNIISNGKVFEIFSFK